MQDSKTISGSIVHITDGAEADARELLVDINPVQSGSGTPSPSNVRPITGWDDVSVYVSPTNDIADATTTTTTLPSTTYGGTIDLVSGVLTVTHGIRALDGTEQYADYWNLSTTNRIGVYIPNSRNTEYTNFWCSHYGTYAFTALANNGIAKAQSTNLAYVIKDSANCLSVNGYKAYVAEQYANGTPITLVYELATPTTAQLTGQQIELLRDCYVWADAGDITLTYETELLDGRFRKIKVNDNSIIAPNNFELEREDVYTAEYTTCTGKLIADKIGWKYADTTMQWDTLPDDMLAILTGTTGAFTLKFTDSDGSHTENVIRLGVRNTATRFTDDFGNALWRNIELEVSFTNVH